MYEEQTFEAILTRMNNRADTMDRRESSIVYNGNAAAAIELQLLYFELDNVITNSYGETASREFLIRIAAQRGISPKPATKAILQAEFIPDDIDLVGQVFNLSVLNYVVTDRISPGVYKIESETAGTAGNASTGMLIPVENIDGLQEARVTDLLIAGEDEEDTESLRQRYLNSFGTKPFGGNITAYKEFTLAMQDVGAVKVIPVWNGGGTVKLIILNSNFAPASEYLVNTVQDVVDPSPQGMGVGTAPIGHVVTVVSAEAVQIDISFRLTFASGFVWENIEDNAKQVIDEYLSELRKSWDIQDVTVVRISQIESRLLNVHGIVDITETKINGLETNFALNNIQVPISGGVINET